MSLYNYVDTPNNNLICCICRAPFTDPTTTRTCAHTFCYECILRALAHAGQCPVDRSALSVEDLCPANPIVRSMVDELVVECVYAGEGCGYTCERQRMVGHLKEECEYAEVGCDVCGEEMQRREVAGHVERVHNEAEEGAEEEGEEERQERSREEKGKGREEERCPHAEVGCGYAGGEVEEHLEECVYEQLKGFLAMNAGKMAALTEQNVMLRHRVEALEGRVESTRREVGAVKKAMGTWGNEGSTLEGAMSGLREEMHGLGIVVEEVRRRNEMALTNETLRLSEEMMSIRAQMHGLRIQMHNMMMDREYTRPLMGGSITKL